MASAHRGGQAVASVNAALAFGLVVALAAFALVVNPPAPPGIPEFAPQAAKPITKAPPGQPGAHGAGAGAHCAAGVACGPSARPGGTATPVPLPTKPGGHASTKQCYEWPDGTITQTWDPQSPPCVADWPGRAKGNGGATARGVSKTEIRVTVPWDHQSREWQPLVDFFNSHFELYDRRIVLVPFTPQSGNASYGYREPAAQRADAEAVASLRPFATLTYTGQPNTKTFTQRVTSAGIVSVTAANDVTLGSESQLRDQAPYAWNYSPTSSDLLDATAAMICRQLAGRPATHSLDYSSIKRSFAVVVPDQSYLQGPLDGLDHLRDTLAGCGLPRPRVVEYQQPQAGTDPSPTITAMAQLHREGITSLVFWPTVFGSNTAGAPQKAASSVAYHPEWIIPGDAVDTLNYLRGGAPDQIRSTFGIASWNRILPSSERPWYRAYTDTGRTPSDTVTSFGADYEALYRSLLLIASGIQLAGPRLTAQGFADALGSTAFPNPGAGASPYYQAHVGFSGDHVMIDDFAGFWIDPSQSPDPSGEVPKDPFCYVEDGRRWNARSWPSGADGFHPGGTC